MKRSTVIEQLQITKSISILWGRREQIYSNTKSVVSAEGDDDMEAGGGGGGSGSGPPGDGTPSRETKLAQKLEVHLF